MASRRLSALGLNGRLIPLILAPNFLFQSQRTENCGIVGVVAAKDGSTPFNTTRDFLVQGLEVLKNRGYDSAGMVTLGSDSKFSLVKYASDGDKANAIALLSERTKGDPSHNVGIAHTRWATHGPKTDANAHPHVGSTGSIALVHNGIINNANVLRKELEDLGHQFTSETDTEVVAKLIGHIYDEEPKKSLKDATTEALARCDGTWGMCILSKDNPDEMVVACNGSPLVIGLGKKATYVASEPSAFNRYTKEFISMKDGEIGVVHADGRELDITRVEKAPDLDIQLSPAPYNHWTIKECFEQPEAVARALAYGSRLGENVVRLGGLDDNEKKVTKLDHMTLSACGTSFNAAQYGARLMKKVHAFQTVQILDSAETKTHDLQNSPPNKSGVIVVSQSGETKDVHRVVVTAQSLGLTVMSVVNAVGSLIARTTKLGVYLNAGRENAVASTKAFTTQVTVLALVAIWFREAKDRLALTENRNGNGKPFHTSDVKELRDSLSRLPISIGMALQSRKQCKAVAQRLKDKEHLFVLGKGFAEPVAYEGALKIKETCYLHAEGYSGGALKHGPFALIEDSSGKFGATPIILIVLDDENKNSMITACEEVKARGAELIIITDKTTMVEGLTNPENVISIPSNGMLTALLAVVPLQLLAYELSCLRGINPDTPRNLAKAVTVD